MKKEYIITDELRPDATINVRHILGAKVLSKTGQVVGRVKQLRMNQKTFKIEGIIVHISLFHRVYIGVSYIKSISNEAVILSVDLSIMIKGKRVVDNEGKIVGKVKMIVRRGERNDISTLVVHKFMRKDLEIPTSAIKTVSKSVILTERYHVKQKYFWKKS
jgi:sporulation protein YlmC with PRC-barrel domain